MFIYIFVYLFVIYSFIHLYIFVCYSSVYSSIFVFSCCFLNQLFTQLFVFYLNFFLFFLPIYLFNLDLCQFVFIHFLIKFLIWLIIWFYLLFIHLLFYLFIYLFIYLFTYCSRTVKISVDLSFPWTVKQNVKLVLYIVGINFSFASILSCLGEIEEEKKHVGWDHAVLSVSIFFPEYTRCWCAVFLLKDFNEMVCWLWYLVEMEADIAVFVLFVFIWGFPFVAWKTKLLACVKLDNLVQNLPFTVDIFGIEYEHC